MSKRGRDLRLDFFRGLGLLFIFFDHIPDNVVSLFTLGSFAFNDAAELFVFISGFSAAMVFGGVLERQGAAFAATQVLRRCWTLYVAHVFLFVIFVANVAYTATQLHNPMFVEEMNVANFLTEPHIAVLKALALQFHPHYMDILPLYIVLLFGFAVLLPIMSRYPAAIFAASAALYVAVPLYHLSLATYPDGVWYFNPLAWQFLFVIGATLGLAENGGDVTFHRRPALVIACALFVAVCLGLKTWMEAASLYDAVPRQLARIVRAYGNKTNLGPIHLLNFLAIADLAVNVIGRDAFDREPRWATPIIQCGQNSLGIFCLGIFLSLTAQIVLIEVSDTVAMQLVVSAIGILIMFGVARFLVWSRGRSRPLTAAPASGQ